MNKFLSNWLGSSIGFAIFLFLENIYQRGFNYPTRFNSWGQSIESLLIDAIITGLIFSIFWTIYKHNKKTK